MNVKELAGAFNQEKALEISNFAKVRFQLYCVTIQQTPDNAGVAGFKDEQIEHFICLPSSVDLDIL